MPVALIARTSYFPSVDCMNFLAALVPLNFLTPSKDFFWCQKQIRKKQVRKKQRTGLEFEKRHYLCLGLTVILWLDLICKFFKTKAKISQFREHDFTTAFVKE